MRWASPSLATLTLVAVGALSTASADAQPLAADPGPRMSSDRIDSARGLGAHSGGDGLQRAPNRRNRTASPDDCVKLCMSESDFEKLKQCTLRCAEQQQARRDSPPGTALIGAGVLVTVLGAGVFLTGVGGICNATQDDEQTEGSLGTCGAGMLVGGLAGMVLGPILSVFGLEQGRPDRQMGSSALSWTF